MTIRKPVIVSLLGLNLSQQVEIVGTILGFLKRKLSALLLRGLCRNVLTIHDPEIDRDYS